MASDAFVATGARHPLCQDYALAGSGAAGPFAIVADGCSSAPDSDIGARCLALAAAEQLRERPALSVKRAAARALAMSQGLGLSPACLDATLLACWRDGDTMRVVVAGDGIVIALGERAVELWEIEAEDAPPYPAYLLDESRFHAYLFRHGRRTVSRSSGPLLLERRSERLESGDFAVTLAFACATHHAVVVASDGASSFRDVDGQRVPTHLVAAELGAFATLEGRFVERRCRRFLGRTCRRRGWRHHDDLAAAAIHPGGRA